MSTTWYEVPIRYSWRITPVLVTRESATAIWVEGRRKQKSTNYETYVPTMEEAKKLMRDRCERTIARMKVDLSEAENALCLLQ